MQQVNPQDAYGVYEGNQRYSNTNENGQKLHVDDDEQYADMLARRIKQELMSEKGSQKDESLGQRLALAIVSVCLTMLLFIALVFAMSSSLSYTPAGPIIAVSFIVACAVIFGINVYFNRAATKSYHQSINWNNAVNQGNKSRGE